MRRIIPQPVKVGTATVTVSEAVAGLPVTPWAVVSVLVVLVFSPVVVPVTFTEKLHEEFAARVAPDRVTKPVPAVAVMDPPPQLPVRPLGVEITRSAGKVSVKPTPVSAVEAFGFIMVNFKLVGTPWGTEAVPKDLVIVGGLPTVMLAVLEVLPVPPLVEVTGLVVLLITPTVTPVTFTEIAHEELAATAPPVKLTEADPAVAVAVPPHVFVSPLGVDTTIPAGKVSVNATPVSATVLAVGLVMVMVSEDVALSAILVGLNALAIEGGATTAMLAEAVPPVPPSVELTAPVVLFCVPPAVPVTFSEKVHDVLAANDAPERLTTFVPCVAVIVPPPQLPVKPLGVDTTRPAGKVSLNPIPVSVVVVFGLLTVKLKEVDPFRRMLAAPKALPRVGGVSTVIEAFEVLPVPPSVEVTWTLLFFTPGAVPVTFTATVHEPFAASVPPDKLTADDPAVAVAVPPQVLLSPLGVATASPAGRLSVKATPVSPRLMFGLVIKRVSVVLLLTGRVAAPKALLIVGGVATVRSAEAVLPVPPFVEVTLPVVLV